MPKLEAHNLSYTYQDYHHSCLALDQLDFTIEAGEFICVVGHSGCGKSTLLNILAGLLPTNGQVLIDGAPIQGPSSHRAIVFQHYSLFPWMTSRANVVFGIRQADKSLTKEQATKRADYYLTQVGMAEDALKYPHQLSGGMRQRVAIARALAMDAEILLLDEPFGALDALRRRELQKLLEQLWLNASPKKTVIFVTHDIDEAILLADRIFFMQPRQLHSQLSVALPRPRCLAAIEDTADYKHLRQQLQTLFSQTKGEPCEQ